MLRLTEFLVKEYVAMQSESFKLTDIKKLQKLIGHLAAEKWVNCVCHIIQKEESCSLDISDRV
jgi:hypothetical protein